MPFPRMQCSDPVKLGKLIERWSRGQKRPETVQDFLEAVAQEGFEVEFLDFANGMPDHIEYLQQDNLNHLYVLLPPKTGIGQAIAAIPDDGSYPLPDFYNQAFEGDRRADMSRAEQEEFAFMRIAEYSTNKCQ